MSASNWSRCPRCVRRAEEKKIELQRRVEVEYGALPLAEFDALRAEADKPLGVAQTWREDYEFSAPEAGFVEVSYSGSCEVCGLSLRFSDRHDISDGRSRG